MDRRSFLKSATAAGLTVGLSQATANPSIPEHNWTDTIGDQGLRFPTGFIRARSHSMVPVRLFPTATS
jgi:hypothetical protein